MSITTVQITDTLNTYRTRLNTVISRWNTLGESGDIVITGGEIDGTTIGLSNPAAGTFTTLEVTDTIDLSGVTLILDDNSISGDKLSGGTASFTQAEITNAPTTNNHTATKAYVDTEIVNSVSNVILYSIFFGG